MKKNYEKSKDFFNSLAFVDSLQKELAKEFTFDDFLEGSLKLFQRKSEELCREKYSVMSFKNYLTPCAEDVISYNKANMTSKRNQRQENHALEVRYVL